LYNEDKKRLAAAIASIEKGDEEGAKYFIQQVLERYEGFHHCIAWSKDDILQAFIDNYGGDDPILVKVKERLDSITDDEMEHFSFKMGELSDADWMALRELFEENYLEE